MSRIAPKLPDYNMGGATNHIINDPRAENERLQAKLKQIETWCDAYPVDVFPELSADEWFNAMVALAAVNIELGRMSASNFRHVLSGIQQIIEGGE